MSPSPTTRRPRSPGTPPKAFGRLSLRWSFSLAVLALCITPLAAAMGGIGLVLVAWAVALLDLLVRPLSTWKRGLPLGATAGFLVAALLTYAVLMPIGSVLEVDLFADNWLRTPMAIMWALGFIDSYQRGMSGIGVVGFAA